MKTAVAVGLGILFNVLQAHGLPDFAKAIQYTPPPNYGSFRLNNDPGDDPFSGDGPGFMFLANDQHSQIVFQIGLVGFSIGNGYRVTYERVGPDELKKYLEQSGGSHQSVSPPVALEKVGGLMAATWAGEGKMAPGAPFKTVLQKLCWVQIQTNIVLKITATAHDPEAFSALTNSLRSLKIDKAQLLESLQPKKPKVTTSHLDKIEVGYMQWRGQRTAAFVFRSKGTIFSFAAPDAGEPGDTVKSSLEPLEKMRDLSSNPNVLRMARVDSGRTGDGPEDYQTVVSFLVETNAAIIAQIKQGQYHGPPLLMAGESWTNREPEGFQKIGEYKVNATLVIRKEQ